MYRKRVDVFFQAPLYLFQNVINNRSTHPKEGTLLGALLLSVAAGCAPLLMRFFPNDQKARRFMAMLVSGGLLLVLIWCVTFSIINDSVPVIAESERTSILPTLYQP